MFSKVGTQSLEKDGMVTLQSRLSYTVLTLSQFFVHSSLSKNLIPFPLNANQVFFRLK